MTAILNTVLPSEQAERALAPRMPGIRPLAMANWLQVSETYAPQMALRRTLIAQRPAAVLAEGDGVAGREILALVLELLAARPDFVVSKGRVYCPDGVWVVVDEAAPLATLGQILQEDVCLLEPEAEAYILRCAVLCFPASWTLAEKMGRPLLEIHTPVEDYTADIAKRVQRLFEAIRPEGAMWRANAGFNACSDLFQPRLEVEVHPPRVEHKPFLRTERQSLLRLEKSRAVAFTIHTYLLAREDVDPEVLAALDVREV